MALRSIKMADTKYEIINEWLVYEPHWELNEEGPWSFCVHATVLKKLEKALHNFAIKAEWEIFDYTLEICGKCYDMYIIDITQGTSINRNFLRELIHNSQFSFPWEDNPTVFINVESFNILQIFLKNSNLQSYILNIEEKLGISANDGLIKVVTFSQKVKTLDIIGNYKNYLSSIETYDRPQYYYMTFAYPWLQPVWLQHFKIPLDDEFHSVFFIVLNHLGTLNYAKRLNIFDLLMLRWALCDLRHPSPSSCLVKYEIDFMIKRELVSNIIKNNHLDLEQYLIMNNYKQIDFLVYYLIYEFQNLFETVKTNKGVSIDPGFDTIRTMCTVELATFENDILNTLKEKSNILFDIDCSSYDRMSLSLFLDLIECYNVSLVCLDTNYTWHSNVCDLNRTINNSNGIVSVELTGKNANYFADNFISALKTIKFAAGLILLKIYCNLNDYRILDKLSDHPVEFYNIKIQTHMLDGLNECNLKSYRFYNCTFESTPHNWALLSRLENLKSAMFIEDENTWQSMFVFIVDEMLKSNSKEYQFENTEFHVQCHDQLISLGFFKFCLDELNSKLELCKIGNNQFINLYDLKFLMKPDDKSEFDFYQ